MKFTLATALALAAVGTRASPLKRADAPTDTDILNYALTLEHLENAFYSGALQKFDAKAFTDGGLPSWARGRFVEIGQHETAHVAFLSKALGDAATKPCTYSFPYTDPKSFAALSQALEGVGVSAYTGAAQFITNKQYLTAAASVLATEARHASWIAGAVNKANSWSGALDVPLSLDAVYSLASAFITGCPDSNPKLPVKAFPKLTFPAGTKPGASVMPTFDGDKSGKFVAFYSGLSQEVVPIGGDGSVTVPKDLIGTVYAIVTTNSTMATDDTSVAGPAILNFAFNSDGTLINN